MSYVITFMFIIGVTVIIMLPNNIKSTRIYLTAIFSILRFIAFITKYYYHHHHSCCCNPIPLWVCITWN